MRLENLRAQLDPLDVDTFLVTQAQNRRYLTGFTGSAGQLIVTREHALLLTDSRYWELVLQQAPGWELVRVTGKPTDALKEQLVRVGAKRLGFESQDVTVDQYERMREALGDAAEWVPTKDVVAKLREVKDPGELEALRRAIDLTDEAFTWMAARLRPGMTEKAVAWEIEKYLREHGAERLSFDTIVASGPNAALPHAVPTDREIQTGEPITIDMGGVVDGYHADLTRTVVLGEPDAKFQEIYGIVLEAQLAAERGMRAGLTPKEADAFARDVIAGAGYGDNFGHSLGHGVGLATHEGPGAGPRSEEGPMPENVAITVEPGIYLPGWGGVRIEDVVVLHPDHAEVLSRSSKEPRLPG